MSASLIIAIVLAVVVIYLVIENRGLAASIERDSPMLTRYIEACRWAASMSASPNDIACYAMQSPSENMKAWSASTGKNPLLITDFRNYLNDSIVSYSKPLHETHSNSAVYRSDDGRLFLGCPKDGVWNWNGVARKDLDYFGVSDADIEQLKPGETIGLSFLGVRVLPWRAETELYELDDEQVPKYKSLLDGKPVLSQKMLERFKSKTLARRCIDALGAFISGSRRLN